MEDTKKEFYYACKFDEDLLKAKARKADIRIELLDYMGGDIDVVNAARVSFNKEVDVLKDKDIKLIKYLAEHGHWTPFAHCFIKFRIKMPIFVARQLIRHTAGLTVNEVSRRYVDEEPEYYFPESWRKRVPNLKQGSSKTESVLVGNNVEHLVAMVNKMYIDLLDKDVAPELARIILPLNMMTEWIWSGSLYAFARVCKLRLQDDAQSESRIVAEGISNKIRPFFPASWNALMEV